MKNLELLAMLENLRIQHSEDDYILRVVSAIVAEYFGYTDRHTWTQKLDAEGLVKYGMEQNIEHAKGMYKELSEKLKSHAETLSQIVMNREA